MVKEVEDVTKDGINIRNSDNITKFSTKECDTKVWQINQVWNIKDFMWKQVEIGEDIIAVEESIKVIEIVIGWEVKELINAKDNQRI